MHTYYAVLVSEFEIGVDPVRKRGRLVRSVEFSLQQCLSLFLWKWTRFGKRTVDRRLRELVQFWVASFLVHSSCVLRRANMEENGFVSRLGCAEDAENLEIVNEIVRVVNAAYERGEDGLWADENHTRTNSGEVVTLLRSSQLVLIFWGSEIVGSALVKPISEGVVELGMLAVTGKFLRKGLGNMLVKAVESRARDLNARILQLELLAPVGFQHPAKSWLERWYLNMGFEKQGTEPFEKHFPSFAKQLAVPCTFTIYRKNLERSE